jgi:CubicO group peptidase (beta-lactamase class C family)
MASAAESFAGLLMATFAWDEQHDACRVVDAQARGAADRETGRPMRPSTWLQMCSLSKCVAAAFAVQYFADHGLDLDLPVNVVLTRHTRSPLRLVSCSDPGWADSITLRHLLSHQALELDYVPGFPPEQGVPPMLELLSGRVPGYAVAALATRPPGRTFRYSGGAFLVLQHVLEACEESPIADMTRPFLQSMGMTDFGFECMPCHDCADVAVGYRTDGSRVNKAGHLVFPALAAGGCGTIMAMAQFTVHLVTACHRPEGSGGLSQAAARAMLQAGPDCGSLAFVGAFTGLGVFVLQAGSNHLALHHASNDGFRGLLLVCFAGPDRGKGHVLSTNCEDPEVVMAQLRHLLSRDTWKDPSLVTAMRASSPGGPGHFGDRLLPDGGELAGRLRTALLPLTTCFSCSPPPQQQNAHCRCSRQPTQVWGD